MKYEEYQKIINDAMYDYVNAGGSTFSLFKVQKRYKFDIEDKTMPSERVDRLIDKAVQAINFKDPLPKGIRLVGCKWGADEWY